MTQHTQELKHTIRAVISDETFDERFRPAAIFVQDEARTQAIKAEFEAERAAMPKALRESCEKADRQMARRKA